MMPKKFVLDLGSKIPLANVRLYAIIIIIIIIIITDLYSAFGSDVHMFVCSSVC